MVEYIRMRSDGARDFGILLGLAYQGFVDALNAHLAAAGFTGVRPSYGYVFRALLEEDLTASQLAGQLRITPQGAAKIVAEMVAAGYVDRRSDPEDGRAKRLRLSDRGRRAVATARRFHASYERQLAETHGAERVAMLREVLAEVIQRDPIGSDAASRLLRPL
jgi:MarR family transcriptional regulator for hemolysin